MCGTGTDEIGIRQANYPSGKGEQMQYSFDESMSALNLVRLQWQILRADLIRGGLVPGGIAALIDERSSSAVPV